MTETVTLTLTRAQVEKIQRDNRPLPGCEAEGGRCQVCEDLAAIREECARALDTPTGVREDSVPSAGYR